MASEIGDLFVTLRSLTEPFTAPLTEAAGVAEDVTSRIVAAGDQMAASLDASSKTAADSFKLILDAAVQLAEAIVAPLDEIKASVRGVSTAVRALGKAAGGLDQAAVPAFEGVAAAAEQMATGLDASVASARTAMAGLGTEFGTVAGEAAASATEITAASRETAAATTEASGAAAASSERSAAAMGETSAGLMKYATGLAAAGFGLFEAIKGATSFNTEMTKINTQAGVSKTQLASLGSGVLSLSSQVGFAPDSLAEALFHVESSFASTGITGRKAMEILKTAGEGAAVGGANLVDVQNALDGAIASGLPGVENYSKAMGALNAIVGAGDMSMQDLANAMSSGLMAVVKGYGLTLNDVGSALATFGDNNIRGAVAATDLRMAVQALAVPTKNGKGQLIEWGQTTDSLAKSMEQHGLVYTLNKLHGLFVKNGVTATTQGAVITDMFGKKAGAGLAVLMGQLDRVNSKVPDIAKGAGGFASAWQTTSHTVGQEWKDLKAGLESLAVKLGTALMPALSKVLGLIREGVSWITQHKIAMEALASLLAGVLVAALWGVAAALTAIEVNPVVLGITLLGAAVFYAWTHFKAFRTAVMDIASVIKIVLVDAFHLAQTAIKDLISWFNGHGSQFSNAWNAVVKAVQVVVKWFDDNVIKWVQARVADLVAWWDSHSQELAQVWHDIWALISANVRLAWQTWIHPLLILLQSVWTAVWKSCWDIIKLVWSAVSGIVTTAMHLILNIIGIVLDLITGHWGKAWQDVKKLVSQGLHDVISTIGNIASGFGTLLYDAGANIIKGLINGITSMISGIGSTISNVASTIRSYLPFSPAKRGPLSGSGSPDIAGAKIGDMLATGITGSVRKVTGAAHGLAGAAALAIGDGSDLGSLSINGGALSINGAAGTSGSQPIIVQIDRKTLFTIMQTEVLRYGRRNPSTGVVYTTV